MTRLAMSTLAAGSSCTAARLRYHHVLSVALTLLPLSLRPGHAHACVSPRAPVCCAGSRCLSHAHTRVTTRVHNVNTRLCARNACARTHAYTRARTHARETKISEDVSQVSFPISAFGCKLALTGSGMEIPKVFTGGAPNYDKKGSKRETRADKLREEQKKKEEEKLKVTVCV